MANTDYPIVITGGAGFLGQNVVKYFYENGLECIFLDKQSPNMPDVNQAIKESKLVFISSDLLDDSSIKENLNKLPSRFHIVHLAAVIETTTEVGTQTVNTLQYHTGTSLNIAENWKERIETFCYISSWEVYGFPKVLPLTEKHELDPFNVYGIGKLLSENYLRVFCKLNDIPLSILRLSHIYGPGEWHNKAIPNFIKNCISGREHRLFGGGKDIREFVHARDVAYAIHLSINKYDEGIYNIAGGTSINIRGILDAVQKLCETNLPVLELPADRPPLDLSFDLTHAKNGLGFEPQISLEEGLIEEIEWFRNLESNQRNES